MEHPETPAQFTIMRNPDGGSVFIETDRAELEGYKYLRTGQIDKFPVQVDEWAHESVYKYWLDQMMNEMFETRTGKHDSWVEDEYYEQPVDGTFQHDDKSKS
jgi:hypothetical protein